MFEKVLITPLHASSTIISCKCQLALRKIWQKEGVSGANFPYNEKFPGFCPYTGKFGSEKTCVFAGAAF